MPDIHSKPCFLTPRRLQPDYPLFVFLPAMDGTGQLLRTQTEGLEAGFDVRCLAIPPDDLTSWDGLVEAVVESIRAELNPESRRSIYLCGESFGGCLAMKVALYAPELFDRIILVNPASSFRSRPWILWGSQLSRYLPESIYQLSALALMPILANLGLIAPEDREALFTAVKSVPQRTSVWRLSLLSEFKIPDEQFQRLTQPVLLLASSSDRLLPSLAEAERLAALLPNVKRVILPHSGHACLLEANVNLYEILKTHNFLPQQANDRSQSPTHQAS